MEQKFKWYLPSFYGDISLEQKTAQQTLVTIQGLSSTEKLAVQALLKRASGTRLRSAWASAPDLERIRLGTMTEQTLLLDAPISQVQQLLSRALKPGRKQVSAVRFRDGKIEEVTEATIGLIETTGEPVKEGPYRERSEELPGPKPKKSKPTAAVTVAQPVVGCPAPDFEAADVRATRVLSAFLDTQQRADFARYQRFVVTGVESGHRYMLTSRQARDELATYHRTLFDLDENTPLCVHDWDVPAAEELLALAILLRLPGKEHYVRSIPDREGIVGGDGHRIRIIDHTPHRRVGPDGYLVDTEPPS
jgi:hypothetical protein